LFFLIFILEFLSCHEDVGKTKKTINEIENEEIKGVLLKYKCESEYENAKYFYYCKFYNKCAVKFRCSNIRNKTSFFYKDSIPISFLNISLISASAGVEIINDSLLSFSFRSYFNDSCFCIETPNKMNYSPSRIIVNTKTKNIFQDVGLTNLYITQTECEINNILNNDDIRIFILKNKCKINKWFLREYFKRNPS
jgi:hypothetical protein